MDERRERVSLLHARIAVPAHVYALPLVSRLEELGFQIVEARPPDALQLLDTRRVDAAIVPLASITRRQARLRICRGPMVWSRGETMSVAVYSRMHKSLDECSVIAVSGESRTSITYLRLVAESRGAGWRILHAHECTSLDCLLHAGDCALLLGDEALRARRLLEPIADLGSLVEETLGINPVYAVTASQGQCPPLPAGEPPVRPGHILEACRRTGLQARTILEYYMRINLAFNENTLQRALDMLSRALSQEIRQ